MEKWAKRSSCQKESGTKSPHKRTGTLKIENSKTLGSDTLMLVAKFRPELSLVRFKPSNNAFLSPNPYLRREQFLQWTEALPDAQSPSWLGLPNNAEKVLLTTQG